MKACDLEEKTNHLQACVAIDLGARYTGTFSILHKSSRLPSKDDCRAATYVLPEDGGKMTYSQRNRTAVRHRIRGKKRFALARRMAARSWPQRASRSLLRKPAVLLKRSAVSCAVVATIVSKPKPTTT